MIKETITTNLQQLEHVMLQISDVQFTRKLPVLNHSTIGMHIRHIIEFYQCLMEANDSKIVDYDSRKRNIVLETQTQKSIAAIHEILDFVQRSTQDFPIVLKANYALNKEESPITIETTLYRELLYNIEHTVHHMAIIKIGIKELEDSMLSIDENFGVAVSTIRNKTLCVQ